MDIWRKLWPGRERRSDTGAGTSQAVLRGDRMGLPPITQRVAMIIHDPIIEAAGGARLHTVMGWHDPEELAVQYAADLRSASGGIARYSVVERHLVDAYPAKQDGFRYDDASYLDCWRRGRGFHHPDVVDYPRLLDEFGLVAKVEARLIDEVWLFGFPYAGYYESLMVGNGACWCNAPPLTSVAGARRRFVVMGFNYERDVGCMLENFGHRVESLMAHVYRAHPPEQNLWARFTRFDRDHPGRAECGNVHFAPNSLHDYDWGNLRPVACRADAWYNFPDLHAPARTMHAGEWGGGDMRLHHLWWLDHLPRVSGSTGGVLNNWWEYLLRVDEALP
jgi:hypothetical protein